MTTDPIDMQSAFQREFGARWSDLAWRAESSVWGRCWAFCQRLYRARIEALEQRVRELEQSAKP